MKKIVSAMLACLVLFNSSEGNAHVLSSAHTTVQRHASFRHNVRVNRGHIRRIVRHHPHGTPAYRHHASTAAPTGGIVTVDTAAGIPIKVAANLVSKFQGFISDLIARGYTPKHIGCWAPVGTHVANSNHYHGGACDFDQTGWDRTASAMYHVGDLAKKWGLRDGCSFRRPDCGHIDDGWNIGWILPHNLIAKYIRYQTSPVPDSERHPTLEPFEE